MDPGFTVKCFTKYTGRAKYYSSTKIVIYSYSPNRADRSEKRRKELEHICNFNEERTEKDEKALILAKNTTRDAYEKYEESARRLNNKEKVAENLSLQVLIIV